VSTYRNTDSQKEGNSINQQSNKPLVPQAQPKASKHEQTNKRNNLSRGSVVSPPPGHTCHQKARKKESKKATARNKAAAPLLHTLGQEAPEDPSSGQFRAPGAAREGSCFLTLVKIENNSLISLKKLVPFRTLRKNISFRLIHFLSITLTPQKPSEQMTKASRCAYRDAPAIPLISLKPRHASRHAPSPLSDLATNQQFSA